MSSRTGSPTDVQNWFEQNLRGLSPAALGSLSLRRTRCIRSACSACEQGHQHRSHVLYVRVKARRYAIYVPEDLVAEIEQVLERGRQVQALLYEAAVRYAQALKRQRNLRRQQEGQSE
jgi:hypothetical protein